MCSVFGYIGKQYSRQLVLDGLKKLEYRGYDSAGFACLTGQPRRLSYVKAQGHLEQLQKEFLHNSIDGLVSIGHTRWATHGGFSIENAHPHFDCEKKIALMHNGIIENHHELKEMLVKQGHHFHSKTDSEVIAHLLEQELKSSTSFTHVCKTVVNQLEGAYAIVCIFEDFPDRMFVARKRSPLCVGIGAQEMFIASDPMAFIEKTNKVLFLPDDTFAIINATSIQLYDNNGKELDFHTQTLLLDAQQLDKKGHEHFMLKEIYEQKDVIQATIAHLNSISDKLWLQLGMTPESVKKLKSINMVGCGTSWFAGRIAQFFFESICQMPASVLLASEFRYMPFFGQCETAYIAISQSGETADTLEALRLINSYNVPTIALSNVNASSLVREAKGYMLTKAGAEIAVASTKAFSTQISSLYWLANRIALEKGLIDQIAMDRAIEDLLYAAEILENVIDHYKDAIITHLAPLYAQFNRYIFLGRHISYPFAMEAALKLKELSYIFSQCYPAGELKHGPLALVDAQTPVIIFSHLDPLIYQKLVSNAQEVKARNGHLLVFAFEGQLELLSLADTVFVIPKVNPLLAPLAMTGLMQFFVYQIAKVLERPIDKPRNLAKSVTVE